MKYQDVLSFWFEELSPKDWFEQSDEVDAQIHKRFADVHAKAAADETQTWRTTAEGRLAEIIVLDQFSRNMFRGTPNAFAYDAHALSLAEDALQHGVDTELTPQQRHFMYMPYMHSESKHMQAKSVALFEMLGNAEALTYAKEHRDIIERFGRFPHRNAILGRTSTPEEQEFLKTHSGF
jgi:uncharacterized protein (DUF924 family)